MSISKDIWYTSWPLSFDVRIGRLIRGVMVKWNLKPIERTCSQLAAQGLPIRTEGYFTLRFQKELFETALHIFYILYSDVWYICGRELATVHIWFNTGKNHCTCRVFKRFIVENDVWVYMFVCTTSPVVFPIELCKMNSK